MRTKRIRKEKQNSIDQAAGKEPKELVHDFGMGYFFFGVMRAQEFTHRTAQTNINGDKQREVVRVNASHIQFARNDLGSSV